MGCQAKFDYFEFSGGTGGFLVMAAPEGNEFCLLPKGPLHIDTAGHAHYPEP
jgi:hypothetical protein